MGLIWTSNDSEFPPRRSGYSWEVLSSMLGRELGSEYEQLLAEPVPRRGEGKTDWYAPLEIRAVPASDLGVEARAALFERIEGMRRQILALAGRIEAPDQRTANRGLAEELRAVINVPDDNRHVWSQGGNPLLVAWGRNLYGAHAGESGSLLGVGIAERVPTKPADDEPVVPPLQREEARSRFPWALPLWLIFVALVGICYYLLLQACGIVIAPENTLLARFLPRACSAEVRADPIALERARQAELGERIRQAELDVARIEGDCAIPVQVPRRPMPSLQERADCRPRDQLSERLQREHAQIGNLEIALEWNGREDLDLHVICPGGEIHYQNKTDCGGGQLDTDMNGGGDRMSDRPVEHVVWQANPPQGNYSIYVIFFKTNGQQQRTVPFDVYITRDGQREGPFHGTASQVNQRVDIRSIVVDANQPPEMPSQECTNQ